MKNAFKESAKNNETKPIRYYGQKLYSIGPVIARRKPVSEKTPDYQNEDVVRKDRGVD